MKRFSGKELEGLRKSIGLGREEFRNALLEVGHQCGVNSLLNWERRGIVPRGDTLYALKLVANAYGVPFQLEDFYR